jgi:hypothetical protein
MRFLTSFPAPHASMGNRLPSIRNPAYARLGTMVGTQRLARRDLADALALIEESHAIADPDDLARQPSA